MTSGSAMLTSLFLIKDLKYGGWRKVLDIPRICIGNVESMLK